MSPICHILGPLVSAKVSDVMKHWLAPLSINPWPSQRQDIRLLALHTTGVWCIEVRLISGRRRDKWEEAGRDGKKWDEEGEIRLQWRKDKTESGLMTLFIYFALIHVVACRRCSVAIFNRSFLAFGCNFKSGENGR